MAAIHNLVERVVDYAGLFPPAGLPLPDVIQNYAGYLKSDFSWMLGRLVVPAGRLNEFSELAKSQLPADSSSAWLVSALLPSIQESEKWQFAIDQVNEFNARHSSSEAGWSIVDAIECRAAGHHKIRTRTSRNATTLPATHRRALAQLWAVPSRRARR